MDPSVPEFVLYYVPGVLLLSSGVAIAIVEIVAPDLAIRWRQRLLRHGVFNPLPLLGEAFDRVMGLDTPDHRKAQLNVRTVRSLPSSHPDHAGLRLDRYRSVRL